MNVFTQGLQRGICVNGTEYPVRTDFRVWIEFGEIMHADIPVSEKLYKAVTLCFDVREVKRLPPDIIETVRELCRFYSCGRENTAGKTAKKSVGKQMISFSGDWGGIYASFLAEYGIDLLHAELHWHCFTALLYALPESSAFMRTLYWRTVNPSDFSDISARRRAEKMKRICALPEERSAEEREADFAEKLAELF